MITLTDNITGTTATVPAHDIAETLTPWYPEAPSDVTVAIEDLQEAVQRHDSGLFEIAEYLNLTVSGV